MGIFSDKDQKDIEALKDAGYSTDDIGRGNNAITERDVADLTNDSWSSAAAAGHDSRERKGAFLTRIQASWRPIGVWTIPTFVQTREGQTVVSLSHQKSQSGSYI